MNGCRVILWLKVGSLSGIPADRWVYKPTAGDTSAPICSNRSKSGRSFSLTCVLPIAVSSFRALYSAESVEELLSTVPIFDHHDPVIRYSSLPFVA
jgi:hypothetical protein